jgi:hypothetical protein
LLRKYEEEKERLLFFIPFRNTLNHTQGGFFRVCSLIKMLSTELPAWPGAWQAPGGLPGQAPVQAEFLNF